MKMRHRRNTVVLDWNWKYQCESTDIPYRENLDIHMDTDMCKNVFDDHIDVYEYISTYTFSQICLLTGSGSKNSPVAMSTPTLSPKFLVLNTISY